MVNCGIDKSKTASENCEVNYYEWDKKTPCAVHPNTTGSLPTNSITYINFCYDGEKSVNYDENKRIFEEHIQLITNDIYINFIYHSGVPPLAEGCT